MSRDFMVLEDNRQPFGLYSLYAAGVMLHVVEMQRLAGAGLHTEYGRVWR